MFLHLNLKRNNKGIGTVFGMVFFLLIVMVVFASFIIVLTQNTGFEQTTVQAKQLDLDRYAELQTMSVANPETAVNNHLVYVSCTITNNGTLPTELVRLWIRDITQNTTGNTELSPSIMLQPGSSTNYFNFSYVANSQIYDQFSFWFITTRGNIISAYPNLNQFQGIVTNSTFPGVTDINSTYSGDQTPLRLSLNTTKTNQLIYVVVSYDDENTLYAPTSTPTLTWTKRSQSLDTDYGSMDGDSTLETYYAIKPSIGPLQINIQSTADVLDDYYCSALAFAISDVNTTSPFDGSAQTTVAKSTMPIDTITTHFSNELIIGALSIDSLNPAISPGPGFAEIMPVQSSYGASGEPDAQPRSVWSEWEILDAPRNNFSINCTFTSTKNWAIVVDAVRLVVIPPTAPVSLFPTSGPSGQPVTVLGQGFAANSQLLATFDGKQVPFSFTTDASGNIPSGATFTVPIGSSAGNKTVTIIDSKFNYASANFIVTAPTVNITPKTGPIGTAVMVTGSNFIDSSSLAITFDGNPVATLPYPITADANGNFSAIFNLNFNETAGVKQVVANDGVNSGSASFNVTSSIVLSPTIGIIGSPVNVLGYGFAASQPIIVKFAGSTVISSDVTTDNFGFFSSTFNVVNGQTAGGKTVNASDANSNFAIATFTVNPSISLSPTSGDAGSIVTVSGSGFAATKTLTGTYAGSPITLSGTTSTDATGSFSGASFTVPISTTGGNQTVVIRDSSSNSSSAIYSVNTLYQSITVTMGNSAPSTTVTVNGGYPSPNAFAADGNTYNIIMVAGAPFTLSLSGSANMRNGFNVANAFSATSSSYTASTNSLSLNAYLQVQNTFSATFNSGNPNSGDSITLLGTYLGTSSSPIAVLNSSNSWRISNWTDYNTAVSFPASTANSGSSEHWILSSPYSTALLTTGGSTYSQTYYHQCLQTLSYIANGSPSAPTTTGTAFGIAYTPSLTTTAAGYWFDASGTLVFSTVPGSAGERWAPNPASVTATSTHNQVVNMNHQYQVSFAQTGIDSSAGSNTVLTLNSINYAYNALPSNLWVDSGVSFSWTSTIAGGAGKQFVQTGSSGVSPISSAGSYSATYKTQFDLKFAQSGLDNTTQSTVVSVTIGANSPVNLIFNDFTKDFGFIDSTTNIAYTFTSTLASSTAGKQFVLTTPAAAPASGFPLSAATTVTGTYKTQYQLTVTSAHDSPNPASGSWFDAGSSVTEHVTTPADIVGGTQYRCTGWSSGTGGIPATGSAATVTFTISGPATITWNWQTQYLFTVTSAAGTSGGQSSGYYDSGTSITSSVFATVNLSGPPAVNYTSTGFTGTGDAPLSGSGSVSFTITQTSNVTWHWTGQLALYPDAFITEKIPSETPNNSNHWTDVSDTSDSTYVYTSQSGTFTDSYSLQSIGSVSGTISSATQYVRVYFTAISSNYATTSLALGGNTITSNNFAPTAKNTWTTHSDTFTRPGGGAWTMSDLNSLQSGLTLHRSSGTIRASDVWVVVVFST
jgi:hypothetical protein